MVIGRNPCHSSPQEGRYDFTVSISIIPFSILLFRFFLLIQFLWLWLILKVEKGGEDAFFVSSHNGGVIGVADGVSG